MTFHFLAASDAYDAAVDDAIATCNGDLRGALKALIIANEFLERDLRKAAAWSALFDGIRTISYDVDDLTKQSAEELT
ncbi:MAG TPA: hypothetical protein VKB08_03655 [Bradyrhizobium sp.]|nr:hypothetical protein [Bradyrhizobium sp.]